jgi:KDO2-lipid IV(A) lauroyltransferase
MNQIKRQALITLLSWFGRVRPVTRLRVGAVLTWFTLLFARRRRHIVRVNLRLCFPHESQQTRDRWLRQHFRALCQSVVDRGVLWYGTPEVIKEMITISGHDELLRLVQKKQPLIMLAPHFIGLDAAATQLSMTLPTSATMYTPQRNTDVDAIVQAGRTRFNDVHLVSRKEGVRRLIHHLSEARPVYYMPDMDFGREGAIFVPFFGVPAATILSTARIAQKWSTPVFPVIEFWNSETGRYHVEVLPALKDFPGEDSLERATARLNHELEQWVLRCPSQYYWVHRRFKTRPNIGEKKFY